MTVESYYVIAIATLSDWLKRLAPVFNQWDAKPIPIAPCTRDFSPASSELQVIARNCDWFIALSEPVAIGRSNCFGFGFSTVIWKPVCYLWRCVMVGLAHDYASWRTFASHINLCCVGHWFFFIRCEILAHLMVPYTHWCVFLNYEAKTWKGLSPLHTTVLEHS